MEFSSRALLTTLEGQIIGDITQDMLSGEWSRKHRAKGESTTIISSDSKWLDEIRRYETGLMFETIYEDGSRDVDFDGIITNVKLTDSFDKVELLSNDRSVAWQRNFMDNGFFPEGDVATVAEQALSYNLGAWVPRKIQTYSSGFIGEIDVKSDVYVSEAIDSLVSLSWTFVGSTLFLFGFGNPNNDFERLDFDFLTVQPILEQPGNLFANAVLVRGTGFSSYKELPNVSHLIARRFDIPELKSQGAVDRAANELLAQVSRLWYINLDDEIPLNVHRLKQKLIDLIPGIFIDVNIDSPMGAVVDRFILDSVKVDAVNNSVSVTLVSIGRVDG